MIGLRKSIIFAMLILVHPLLLNSIIHMDDTSQSIGLAIRYHNLGRLDEAQALYQHILHDAPQNSDAWHLLGLIAFQRQDYPLALNLIRRAIVLHHDVAIFHNSLASVFLKQEQFSEAIESLQRALTLHPNYREALLNLAQTYLKLNYVEEAIEMYQRASSFYPQDIDLLYLLGNALGNHKRFEEAAWVYQKALLLHPHHEGILDNLGRAWYMQYRFTEALTCYQKIAELSPHEADGEIVSAQILALQGKTQAALAKYRKILEQFPASTKAAIGVLSTLLYDVDSEPSLIFLEHQNFDEHFALPLAVQIQPHQRVCSPQQKLKIGYLSADFRQHVMARFIEPILVHHDAQQFEIFCYALHSESDQVTQRLQHHVPHFMHCVDETDEVLTERIRQDHIHILVDLMGYTLGNRFAVLARKPAPIQVAYLGYSNTTGLTVMDYRITDDYADPPSATDSSEVLVKMPHSYFCYSWHEEPPPVNELPVLSNGYITFGSLNNYSKLNGPLLSWWAKILHAVPHSKLLIKTKVFGDPFIYRECIAQFAQLNIEAERLILIPYVQSLTEHLSIYHHIDIALDSYPYNGATTTCEALSMGVPVITLVGNRHVSRMGSSILHAVGLTDLITQTAQEYIHRSIHLAHQIDFLSQLRKTLRGNMHASPLMAGQAFTHHLEMIYKNMWKTWWMLSLTAGGSHEI